MIASATYRALARTAGGGRRDVADNTSAHASQILASAVPAAEASDRRRSWRGHIDALAMRARFSDSRQFDEDAPVAGEARVLFERLEQNRVESLACRTYRGVAANLAAVALERWARARPAAAVHTSLEAWLETFALLARVPIGAPPGEDDPALSRLVWQEWVSEDQARELRHLGTLTDDQRAFGRQCLRLIDLVIAVPGAATPPWWAAAAKVRSRTEVGTVPGTPVASDDHAKDKPRDAAAGPRAAASVLPASMASNGGYSVYSAEYDLVTTAAALFEGANLEEGRMALRQLAGGKRRRVTGWAHRLRRALLARQRRAWRDDQDEGELDPARLTRVLTHPLEPLAYRRESASTFPETVVSVLIDNSGSMRGLPIATAALCAETIGRALESCGVRTEVLGFTTRSWHGGRPRQRWLAAGRPISPGRLTELCHIVYKDAAQSWRHAARSLGAMTRDEFLKENVDGEALLWAAQRLQHRWEPRKILIVLSDGAPMDEATLESNDAGFLERHLQHVIREIGAKTPIELGAIGIGHPVGRLYRRAVMLQDAEGLGEAIVLQLFELFAPRGGDR